MIVALDERSSNADPLIAAIARSRPALSISLELDDGGPRADRVLPIESPLAERTKHRVVSVAVPRRWAGRLAPAYAPWVARRIRGSLNESPEAWLFTLPTQRALVRRLTSGPRAYLALDDYRHYGWLPERVHAWEERMLAEVDHVFVISGALGRHFEASYGYPAERITVVPNGLQASNIPSTPPSSRHRPCAEPIPAHFRPLAGVIGDVSDRVRWDWVLEAARALPWLYIAIVGPVSPKLRVQRPAFEALLSLRDRVTWLGARPYAELDRFAKSFDVALLPYNATSVNPLGSPTRFFTSLPAACPILASPGCEQLETMTPLVEIARTVPDWIGSLERLRANAFDDGFNEARWRSAREHTWDERAARVLEEWGV